MLATLEAPAPIGYDLAKLADMTVEQLRGELAAAIAVTSRHLLYLAAVWSELERRGEDLTEIRSGIAVYLPLIAAGTVVPEVIIRFAGMQETLRAVTGLPPDVQRKIANGDPVQLVVREGTGYTHRLLPVHSLGVGQLRQVFADHHIRSEAEQIAILSRAAPVAKEGRAPARGKARANKAKGVVQVGHRAVEPADLLAALADLRSGNDRAPEAGDPSVSARLTPEEHETLKRRAAAGNTTVASLVRSALQATGMI